MSENPSPPTRAPVEPAPAIKLGPIVIHRKLRTGLREAPWTSMIMLSFVWFTWGFHVFTGGVALTFTIKRYTENPQIMALITSIATIIMLGPFISYMSDKVWTKSGRRRPFLITAWLAGALGMTGIGFLPELQEGIDRVAGMFGLPGVSHLVLLVCIVVAYTTFWDLTAPLEPLFLECVPPHQRGRFFAIRNMLFQCSALLFYQMFWPVFDETIDVFAWLGSPGALEITGQRAVYIISAATFFITAGYLIFCVEETKVESAPNLRFRDLGVGKFVVNYFKDVFFAKDLYPFYIVLIIPTLDDRVWGNFGPLMQETQFGYSKAVQAQWGLPMQLLAIFLITPIAGWYSDRKKRVEWSTRACLLALAAGAFASAQYFYHGYFPADIRSLPPLWVCFAINGSVAVCTGCVLVVMVETLLDHTGREHSRAWVSTLAFAFSFVYLITFYTTLMMSEGRVMPVTLYMAMQQVNSTVGAVTGVFVGPMIYEYIARSKMGTINAGRSLAGAFIGFITPNLGAWWVVFYTSTFGAPASGKFDYTSLYLLQFVLFIPGIWAKIYFIRLVATGRMPRTGVLEVEGDNAAADAAKASKVDVEPVGAGAGKGDDSKLKPVA